MTGPDPSPPDSDGTASRALELATAERLTFFSDAVVAIAITLLALALPLPRGTTDQQVIASLGSNADAYWAFLISFTVVGAHWAAHHRTFVHVTRLTGRLLLLNMAWLLLIVATPYATRVLTGQGAFPVRFTIYAGVQAALFFLWLLIVAEIVRENLLTRDAPPGLVGRGVSRSATMGAAFALSIPVAYVTHWAYVLWVAVPLAVRLGRRLRGLLGARDLNIFSKRT